MLFFRIFFASLLFVIVLGGSMARSFGYYKQEIYLFQEWLGGDKVTHIIMGFAILLALRLLLPKPPLFFLTFGVLIILALDELGQIFQLTRSFSYHDFFASVLGTCFAFTCIKLIEFSYAVWRERSSSSDK